MYDTLLEAPGPIWIGLGLLVLGSLIRFGQWTFLIAGYDESTAVSEPVLARLVGSFVLRVGVVTVLFGYVAMQTRPASWLGLTVAALVVVATGRLIYRLHCAGTREQSALAAD